MAHLIIGHTTETTARIWVRGDKCHRTCEVAIQPTGDRALQRIHLYQRIRLFQETDYTGTVDFGDLLADTEYRVTATLSPEPKQEIHGRFHTIARPPDGRPLSFSFVLSSCNLSVVSINNFLALLLATAGSSVASTSLTFPLERWQWPIVWLRRLARPVLKFSLGLVAKLVKKATGIKQPGPPYIRSPFLKLSAIFDSWLLEIVANEKSLPAVGDLVCVQDTTGVVACSPTKVEGTTTEDGTTEDGKPKSVKGQPATVVKYRLVLTQVEGTFKPGDLLCKRSQTTSDGEKKQDEKQIGSITEVFRGSPWYQPPSFFIHAGDQIYYDFPVVDRRPDKNEYRLAYREAWFDDDAKRHLLSHWPHYMTLDDHEIADQFARDFEPPKADVHPDTYLREASVAYREYAQAGNPPQENDADAARRKTEPYWYCFDKGNTRFFVLDTRTERFNKVDAPPQMIDETQMCRLLEWMTDYKDDLKFVVTSVPFVAEINDVANDETPRWHTNVGSQQLDVSPTQADDSAATGGNSEHDKWSATRFQRQRSQIIEYIAEHDIEHLVFLTGDMHCCYHASMRIGTSSKYESITVHELAGGPVNQLQLADVAAFVRRRTGRTAGDTPGGIPGGVAYEVVLDRFHGEVNAVMHLKVEYVDREQITSSGRALTPEVEWNVIRTLTDAWTESWSPSQDGAQKETPQSGERTMTGRISFVTKRTPSDLCPWPEATARPGARADDR